MTAFTLQVICKNPPVTLHEICKNLSKISKTPLIHGHFRIATKSAVTICSEKFGCPSQELLPKFKEHLFLMTAFQVFHMSREHEKGSSKFGGVEGASVNVWESMGNGLPRKRNSRSMRGGTP